MKELMKNISKSEVLTLRDQVLCQPGQVVSKTLAQNDALSITLFAFDKDEEISTHASGGDAFVTCLEGVGKITIDGVDYELHEGESIVMPAGHPMYWQFSALPVSASNPSLSRTPDLQYVQTLQNMP